MYNIEWARHSEYYIGVSEILMNYLTISLGSIYFLAILTFPLAENSRRELMQKTVAENCCREVVQRTVGNCGSVLVVAIIRFEERIKRECGLVLQRTKCEVFSWSGVMPDNPIPGFTLAGTMVEDIFQPGFICEGAQTDEYVEATMDGRRGEYVKNCGVF